MEDSIAPDERPGVNPSQAVDSPTDDERAEWEARYRRALDEVEQLSRADDRATGSADRTSREAGRAMWLAEAERLRVLLDAPVEESLRDSLEGRVEGQG